MIEIKKQSTEDLTTRTIRVEPVEPFVCPAIYTNGQQFYADRITLVFKRKDGGAWWLDDVTVTGDRRLDDGRRGKEVKSTRFPSYTADKRPAELTEIIEHFRPED